MKLEPSHQRSSKEIAIGEFSQIFHWPLSLEKPGIPEAVEQTRDSLQKAGWQASDERLSYEETVYFHDFVQSFLNSDSEENASGRHCRYKRSDLKKIEFRIPLGRVELTRVFHVERLELDLFEYGFAVITLQISTNDVKGTAPNDLKLAEVLNFTECLRRVMPGFWRNEGQEAECPGLCPSRAVLTYDDHSEKSLKFCTADQSKAHLKEEGDILLLPWWQEIGAGLSGLDGGKTGPKWRNVLDERIPVMSFVRLADLDNLTDAGVLRQITPADWHRIAEADSAGDSFVMPYSDAFLGSQQSHHFYDRHAPGDTHGSAMRITYAGHHHAFVGAGWFFGAHLAKHFRGIYRHMHFIAVLEFAAMLTFSRQLTNQIRQQQSGVGEWTDEQADKRILEGIHSLRRDFLDFMHRYHFTDVSNHLQAREMNRLLRETMGLDELRRDVEEELRGASEYGNLIEQRGIAEAQTQLTEFATLFLPITLGTGFAGMNILASFSQPQEEGAAPVWLTALYELAFWMGSAFLLACLVLFLLHKMNSCKKQSRLGVACLLIGLSGLIISGLGLLS